MNANFSRPSLGLNQSSLFEASNDLATCSLSRNEFAKNPDAILDKYGIPSVGKSIYIDLQKTSEICTAPIGFCLFIGAVAIVLVAGVAVGVGAVMVYYHDAVTKNVYDSEFEVYGINLMPSLAKDNYVGIC